MYIQMSCLYVYVQRVTENFYTPKGTHDGKPAD